MCGRSKVENKLPAKLCIERACLRALGGEVFGRKFAYEVLCLFVTELAPVAYIIFDPGGRFWGWAPVELCDAPAVFETGVDMLAGRGRADVCDTIHIHAECLGGGIMKLEACRIMEMSVAR